MADFFTQSTFTHGFVPLGAGAGGVNLSTSYKTYSTGADPYFSLEMVAGDPSNVPCGIGMEGQVQLKTSATSSSLPSGNAPTDDTVTAAQANVAAAQSTLASEQAALATAQAAVGPAQSAQAAAAQAAATAQTALDAANQEVSKARIQLNTASLHADTAGEIVAQARLDAATTAQTAADAELNRAQLALQTAQTALQGAMGSVLDAQIPVAGAQTSLVYANLALGFVTAANALFDAAAVGASFTWFSLTNLQGSAAASSSFGDSLKLDYDANSCPVAQEYTVGYTDLYYRMDATLPDALYQAIAGSGATINGAWSEVTYQYNLITDHVAGSGICPGYDFYNQAGVHEPASVTVVSLTESYDPSNAVQQPDGTWLIAGTDRSIMGGDPGTISAPNPPQTVSVLGVPALPTCTVAELQLQGAQATRYGWSEFTVSPAESYARRYRTLSASNGPGTPAGTVYSGTLRIDVPPPGYDPGNYPPPDPDTGLPQTGLPAIINFLGGQETPPVVIYDTLSGSCGADRPLPDSLAAVTDGAALTSATTRLMSSPPGLLWTLSDETTPADIAGTVAAALAVAWPTLAGDGSTYVPAPGAGSLGFQGAIYFAGSDGDFTQGQKMRYKLGHNANDTRVLTSTSFSVTTQWLVRRRNLDTGEVTDTPQSRTLTFPVSVPVLDGSGNPVLNPDGTPRVNYVYTIEDADWTEIDAPSTNESVELVMLPGTNTDPRTFDAPRAQIVAADG